MADEATTQSAAAAAPLDPAPASSEVAETEAKAEITTNGVDAHTAKPKDDVATIPSASTDAAVESKPSETASAKQTAETSVADKPTNVSEEDADMKDAKVDEDGPAVDESILSTADTPAAGDKSKARRKSGVPEHKGKKLNKKASKAKMTHIDAKPGDYFYIRLKGYPLWPGIVASEDMLPGLILKTRPVTAAQPDGTYRQDYADGGSKVNSRTFPVMYLYTNEFSWIPNTDLVDMDFETVGQTTKGMKKDLAAAHELAAEKHDLDYFRDSLKRFEEETLARAAEAKAKKSASKAKPKKATSNVVVNDAEDVEMADVTLDPESGADTEEAAAEKPKKKSAKRKAEDAATPADSAKKPKTIKLNITPKTANGTSTPKSAKDTSSAKASKPKKKASTKTKDEEEPSPKEPELTAEEKRFKKEKEILFLRHKLQKGLLTRDQDIKEEDMKQMSEFVTKLEGYADLEVSIIRVTKINKVLKAILKLNTIPKEEEFQFKPRSQSLLNKWNKLLESEPAAPAPATTNGAKEAPSETNAEADEEKASPDASTEPTNGVKQTDNEVEDKAHDAESKAPPKAEVPNGSAPAEKDEGVKDSAPVESTA